MSLGNPVSRDYAIQIHLAAPDRDEMARLYEEFIAGGGELADLVWDMIDVMPPGARALLVAEAVVRVAELEMRDEP
jgi:hypothetical protein